jgi:predicted RecB family nuclease
MLGLQCPKLLWWTVHEPDATELDGGDDDHVVLDRGIRVGELAREYVPGGVLIDQNLDIPDRIAATELAIDQGAPVIYEASVAVAGVFVSVDILERHRAGFIVTEVKSTTRVKEQHLPDVALQAHVISAAGLGVTRLEIMHLNRQCRHPDLSNLFVREDVTALAKRLVRLVPRELDRMQRMLAEPLPNVAIGAHCNDPYQCPFQSRCWPEQPKHHVSTLYRIRTKKVERLVADGYETLHDLPKRFRASGPAKRQIRSVKAGEVVVEQGLRRALAKLKEPIAFLDFETVAPAVPVWPGCRPYDQVPVQLSCHVLQDAKLAHHEWLADGAGDPRRDFVEALASACDGARTIVCYNAPFEIRCIKDVAEALPDRTRELRRLAKRIHDLLPIVRDHVYHPDFGGSFSLKAILPALVPGLGYQDLEIQGGGTASAALEQLLLRSADMDPSERAVLREQLLRYCGRDTLAMVRLYERLLELAVGRKETQQDASRRPAIR